jgi:SRSO17 transposase
VVFANKPQLATRLIKRASGWKIARAPVLGDEAYGKNSELRAGLHDAEIEYVLSLNSNARVYDAETVFETRTRHRDATGPATSRLVADRPACQVRDLAAGLPPEQFQTLTFRTREEQQHTSRFAMLRVIAATPIDRDHRAPREEWLIIEWPENEEHPSDYWISNLPADTPPERLARLARLRWVIELDYRQLKGELGLDHYEGRSYLGFHHHCAIVTAAHGFLTLERLDPNRQRPA